MSNFSIPAVATPPWTATPVSTCLLHAAYKFPSVMRFKRTAAKMSAEASVGEAMAPGKIEAEDRAARNGGGEKSDTVEGNNPDSGFEEGLGLSASAGMQGGREGDPAAARASGESSDNGNGGGGGDAGITARSPSDGGLRQEEGEGGRGRRAKRPAVGGRTGAGGAAARERDARRGIGKGGGPAERGHDGGDEYGDAHVAGKKPRGASTAPPPPATGNSYESTTPASPAKQEEGGKEEGEAAAAAAAAAAEAVITAAGESERSPSAHLDCAVATTEGAGGARGGELSQCHVRAESEGKGEDPSALPALGSGDGSSGSGSGDGGGGAVDPVAGEPGPGPPEGSASLADGAVVTGVMGGVQPNGVGSGLDSTDNVVAGRGEEGAAAAGLEATPGQQGSPGVGVPPKASRTLADAAAFVEAEGIAADAAYTDALNAAQAQEGHQAQGQAPVSEVERALAAMAAAALQPSAGSAAIAAAGVAGGAANAPAAPAGVKFSLAEREKEKEKEKERQLYEGDCSAADEVLVLRGWRQLQAPHMAFIQCQLAVLGGLVMMILICWRRHGRMISVLYAPPADVATQCQVASTP